MNPLAYWAGYCSAMMVAMMACVGVGVALGLIVHNTVGVGL